MPLPRDQTGVAEHVPRVHALRQLEVVGDDDQDRLLPLVQVDEQRRDGVGRFLIEVAGRLVAQDQAAGAAPARAPAPRAASRRRTARAGRWCSRAASPTWSIRSRARRSTPSTASRATSVGTSTFSSTEHCGSRWWSWNTKPTCRLRNAASRRSSSSNGFCPSSRTRAGRSAVRARRGCRAACSCRCPTVRRSRWTARDRRRGRCPTGRGAVPTESGSPSKRV